MSLPDEPRIYDVQIDQFRAVTQADADFLMRLTSTMGLIRGGIFALMRLQIMIPQHLVDRDEVIAAVRKLEDLALMPSIASAVKSKPLFFEEGELAALRKEKGV